MAALPAKSILDGTGVPITSAMKTALGELHDYLAGLLGTDGAAPTSFKNKVRNGNFNINQRAVSATVVLAAGAYGHDGWKGGASGCTYTFAISANVTTITISAGSLIQVVEGSLLFSGTHTLSWNGTLQFKIDGGTAGDTGMTGTATGGTNMTIETVGTSKTMSKVQLEAGSGKTVFEHRPDGTEMSLCQRHYYSVSGLIVESATQFLPCTHPVTMRAIPTISGGGAGFTDYGTTASHFQGYQTTRSGQNMVFTAEL